MPLEEKKWKKDHEEELRKKWEEEKLYQFDSKKEKPFVVDTPPPYPSGRPWHIGAAAHYSQIDMIARSARMRGFNVLFPIGIDRNGLPVELYTEKKFKISIHDTPREKFIEYCKQALDDLEKEMIGIMKSMGMSGDFENYYRTDSEEYRTLTQSTFLKLWEKGLVYEDERLNNYCPSCKTTIADNEVVYRELPTKLNYLKFKIKETGKEEIVATTRPELLCTNAILIYNPTDERFKQLEGKTAITPLYNTEVPIKAHPMASLDFGSGLVYMSKSAGDLNAVRFLREMNIEPQSCIDKNGRMTKVADFLEGLTVKQARTEIMRKLQEEGLMDKQEDITHRTPACERCKTVLEYIAMPEWYLKQVEFKETLRTFAKEMTFHPESHRQLLLDWIDSVTLDWPISRRRFYATEIPLWYDKDDKPLAPEPGTYHQPWKQSLDGAVRGEERTFDTWMDSGVSPLYISKYLKDKDFHAVTFPATIRPQGKDIVRTWLYYTLLRCHQITDKRAFDHVWVMGYGVDEKGEKMSKSKGNVIDPIPIIEQHGADIFRFWAAAEVSVGSDFRCSEDRIRGNGKFLTKLWNVARFISNFDQAKKPDTLELADQWILSELNNLIDECQKGYEDFNFFVPANKVRDFVWNLFASHYIELAKARAYGNIKGTDSALWTLNHCLQSILRLLAPITPYITDHIYREMYKTSVHTLQFPEKLSLLDLPFKTAELVNLNSEVWKMKKEKELSLRAEVKSLQVPESLKVLENDLKAIHNTQNLTFGDFSIEL